MNKELGELVLETEPSASRRDHDYSKDGGALALYIREIGEVKLLTPQEEIELAALIKKGDELARERMIKANLRLVVKIARDYEGLGVPLLDLISEGNIGLMKAVEKFDPKKGGKLSTYGAWWIKQSIKRALANQSKTIRLPVHIVDKVAQIRRAASRLFEELGREPSDTEVAEELGVPTKRVVRLKKHSMTLVSLDAPRESGKSNAHGTKETTWEETTPDETARSPADIIADKELLETSQDALCNLTPREVLIISSRFGLNGGNPQTLEDIGKRLGITRERVRQIQKQAIIRLQLHEVTRRNIGHTEKAEVHKKEKTLRAALKRPKKKKVNPLFFPVVTKFQQWRPTNGEREDTRAAALSLVAFAYDLPYASVLTAGTERATWARSVAIDLMKKYAIENRGICEIFNASTDDFVAVALTRVSSACRYKNIQDDIAGLDQHLWHIIALLKATA